ncbi:HD domain-containing protein [Accumulibacter sp.]|uniref:HD domain-containing protein n=1 Tax=Accumulibacter sp. TaxID=2053492 RepID=UPI0025F42C6C|nr:HD domain-containing protein [Accumulibacter sp.]
MDSRVRTGRKEGIMLDDARAFALAAHGSQRYGDLPYSHHLDEVVALLSPYGREAQVIGYLHDVLEDTEVTDLDIRKRFGQLVADCVSLLTDLSGANRAERKRKTYARLTTVTGPTELALVVKAADRLANVRSCVRDDRRGLMIVYRSEHACFKRSAYRTGLCDPFWLELDALLAVTPAAAPDHS